ncbi:MAG: phosphomannomutase/phosphoglucomutase [Candidatus Cloacimonetes bacterium]|nr:phosphomannomutase/phosphoglucomutase [Candidatus Cloacimonadota bacterium]
MIKPQIFRQYDIRGVVDEELNAETYYLIGKGFGTYLQAHGERTIVIGGDARHSSRNFMDSFIKGALETGCDVYDIDIVATPVLYFAIWKLQTGGGAMVTASHNPSQYNGCKLNLGLGSVYAGELQNVLKIIQKGDFAMGKGEHLRYLTIDSEYIDYIVDSVHFERPVKVIVDGGNGMGGPYLPEILRRKGCEVIEMYCEPDGDFPNHHPDPTVEKNMVDLARAVVAAEYEVGIGLDGDSDRIGIVDEHGKMLFGDQILNILARDYLKHNPGEKVIADVKCSMNLFNDIKKHGGQPIMYKTGHANIKMYMKEANVKFAGEMSGHVFLADRYLGFDDAIYVSCRFIEIVSHTSAPVSTYLADQPKLYNTPELHTPCADDRKFDVVAKVCAEFKAEGYDVNDIDGARITFADGWGLIRASNTTPVLVTRYEAITEARMNEIKALIEEKIVRAMA